jgi:type I restriction enzyme R subunit
MTPAGGAWNEAGQSEDPAVEFLKKPGYAYVPPETLEAERDSLRDVVLVARVHRSLKRLNPWLSDDNLHKAMRAITSVPAASLIEANEALHTPLTFVIALEQDLGEARKSQQVRFFDFDHPARTSSSSSHPSSGQGRQEAHHPGRRVCFVNGIPLAIIEGKSPTLGDGWKHESLDQFDRYQEQLL